MKRSRHRGRKGRLTSEFEVDLKPMINLLVVLIPFLLTCAEFSKITLVDINLPGRIDPSQAANRTQEEGLNLTIVITDKTITIGAKGGFLPFTNYREYHKYVSKSDNAAFTVEYDSKNPNQIIYSPTDHKKMTQQERNWIELQACSRQNPDDKGNIIQVYYTRLDQVLTNESGQLITTLKAGDRVFPLPGRKMEVVKSISDYKIKPLSAYDKLVSDLLFIKARYAGQGMQDENDIVIAAEDNIAYDKIIQIIDRCRISGFPNVSIAKIQS
jgi:biopolymer transport protein ExbD